MAPPTRRLTVSVHNRTIHAVNIYRPGVFRSTNLRVEPNTLRRASFRAAVSNVDWILGRRYQFFYLMINSATHKVDQVKVDWRNHERIIVTSGYLIHMSRSDSSGALDVEVAHLSSDLGSTSEELCLSRLREKQRISRPEDLSSTSSSWNLGDRNEAACSQFYLDGEWSPMSRRPPLAHSC